MIQAGSIIEVIHQVATQSPDGVALAGDETLTYYELIEEINRWTTYFESLPQHRIAVDLENSPAWAVIDLAMLAAAKVAVPVPAFFSRQQIEHLLQDSGVELLLTADPEHYSWLDSDHGEEFMLCGRSLYPCYLKQHTSIRTLPENTCKVTYTSGTTGAPKGVCVSAESIAIVVRSVAERTEISSNDRHLSLLPLTTLLENVAGLYASLVSGATVILLSQQELGIAGSSGIDLNLFAEQLQKQQPTTTILIPQMVNLLVGLAESGQWVGRTLRFAAVGGAPISENLLHRAAVEGLPIYEGYGLSEATSVVSFNGADNNRIGTVGRPLPHIDLKIASDGEVWVRGCLFNGYLGDEASRVDTEGYLPTGDLGLVDETGFLVLQGRKKNLLITSFGRNIAPEWVERELTVQPGILQAVLFGDGRPWNVALIVAMPGIDVDQAVHQANQDLPDYAQVSVWMPADEPFSIENGEWTGTARPRREVIWSRYEARIDALYRPKIENRERVYE